MAYFAYVNRIADGLDVELEDSLARTGDLKERTWFPTLSGFSIGLGDAMYYPAPEVVRDFEVLSPALHLPLVRRAKEGLSNVIVQSDFPGFLENLGKLWRYNHSRQTTNTGGPK